MRASTALRVAVVGEIVLVVLGLVLSESLASTLPAEFQAWLNREPEPGLRAIEVLALVGVLAALASWLIGFVGLLMLRRWGAWFYLAAMGTGYLMSALDRDPVVEVAIADVIDALSIVLSGIVLGVAFFTDTLRPAKRLAVPPPLPQVKEGEVKTG